MARNGRNLDFYDGQNGPGPRHDGNMWGRAQPDPAWTETPEFKALQAEWYAKLKGEGFVDIEAHGGDPTLHDDNMWQGSRWAELQRQRRAAEEAGTAEFFTLAQHWLDTGRWVTRSQRWWWNEWAYGALIQHIYDNFPVRPAMAYSRFVQKFQELRTDMLAATPREEEDDESVQQLRPCEALDPVQPGMEVQGIQAGDSGSPER